MRILKHRRLHINMGPYEHVEISATVEIDSATDETALKTLGIDPTDDKAVTEYLDERLDNILMPDVEDAACFTAEQDSFVLPYEKDKKRMRNRNG